MSKDNFSGANIEPKVALDWYRYGKEHDDDSFVKFMMHWIAFNWMYNSHECVYVNGRCRKLTEREQIAQFCGENIKTLEKYDAFNLQDNGIELFKKEPVRDARTGSVKRSSKECYEKVQKGDITALILTIYQVRCNLFHGSKSFNNDRDRNLVRTSANILEGYLNVLLDIKTP